MMKRLLVLCKGNSARSQIAEGVWRVESGGGWEVHSAGSKPAGYVHPLAIQAMAEVGVDISGHRSKHVDQFLNDPFDLVITVCDHAASDCPSFPGAKLRLHWPFEDPVGAEGGDEENRAKFRLVRDQISARIKSYLVDHSDNLFTWKGLMMNNTQIQDAAKILWQAWQEGRTMECLPENCRPQTSEEGHAVQKALAVHAGRPLLGWKLAATNESAQAFLGVDGPLAGRLLEGTCAGSGTTLSLEKNHMRVAEVEMAFRMQRSLPSQDEPYTVEDVLTHVGALLPAIEIPDSRYTEFTKAGSAQLVADNACASYFVLGEQMKVDWRQADLPNHLVSVTIAGEPMGEGRGENVLGDPRIALAWLANDLASRGQGLEEGQVIMTGTVIKPVAIKPGDHVVGDLGTFGTVEVTLS